LPLRHLLQPLLELLWHPARKLLEVEVFGDRLLELAEPGHFAVEPLLEGLDPLEDLSQEVFDAAWLLFLLLLLGVALLFQEPLLGRAELLLEPPAFLVELLLEALHGLLELAPEIFEPLVGIVLGECRRPTDQKAECRHHRRLHARSSTITRILV